MIAPSTRRAALCVAGAALLATTACRRGGIEGPPPAPRTTLPALTVPQVDDGGLVFDGVLDEPAWMEAATTGAFVHPGNGAHAAGADVTATARVAWSPTGLLVAFEVRDIGPNSPHERDAVDPHIWATASGIELMLQPGDPGDNTHYYEVQVDIAEAVWDTRFDDYNAPITGEGDARRYGHQDWSAELERGVHVRGDGYDVELRLPWSALTSEATAVPPDPGDTWRANLYAFRDGQRAAVAWSALLGEGNFHRSSRFGSLTFSE